MSSHSTVRLRRTPRQTRGRRRVAGFLRAAADVITEMGYERTTMSAIARRTHSSIGSLYQFFPNKRSVAEALRVQCIREVEKYWLALADEAPALTTEKLACRLVTLQLEVVKNYPAILALLDVPATTQTSKWREVIRRRIAGVLVAHKPRMSEATALRMAAVVQHISRGLLMLYGRTDAGEQPAVVEEFKCVLKSYLGSKLRT